MTVLGFALFDSPIGACGVAWSQRGIVAVQLPEAREATTRARMQRLFPSARETAPPAAVERAVERMAALLGGDLVTGDLTGVTLDYDGVPAFHRRIYETVRGIRPGDSMTYGEVAMLAGAPGAARAVGQAMSRNPYAVIVPCHRVVAAGGRVGGFSARGGVGTKLRMLAAEGVRVDERGRMHPNGATSAGARGR